MTRTNNTTGNKDQPVYINGRQAAVLRNYGAVCDIRRRSNGFLYSGGFRVAVSEELLESLPDSVLLQFTNLDTRDVWTITVHDFRHWSEPVQFAGFEPQRACEIARMNHTRSGSSKTRVNELVHLEADPVKEKQLTLLGWMK